jgi:hypothetical protein
MAATVTDLKLIGFSIEVDDDPIELLMQTDKGAFKVEISKAQLSNLVYALRFVLYADEPLEAKRERNRSGTLTRSRFLGKRDHLAPANHRRRPAQANRRHRRAISLAKSCVTYSESWPGAGTASKSTIAVVHGRSLRPCVSDRHAACGPPSLPSQSA